MPRDFTCPIVGTHFMCNIAKCHYSIPKIKLKLLLLIERRADTVCKKSEETKTIIVPNVQVKMNRIQIIYHSIYLASHAPFRLILLLENSVLLEIFIAKDSINRTKHIDLNKHRCFSE